MEPRSIARIVAIIDMTLSSVSTLALTVIFSLFLIKYGQISSDSEYADIVWVAWLAFVIAGVFCALDMYAAWNLIKGTNDTVDIPKGLRCCRIWRGIKVFFTVLQLLGFISLIFGAAAATVAVIISNVIGLFYNSLSVYFVQRYINQLYNRLSLPM